MSLDRRTLMRSLAATSAALTGYPAAAADDAAKMLAAFATPALRAALALRSVDAIRAALTQ